MRDELFSEQLYSGPMLRVVRSAYARFRSPVSRVPFSFYISLSRKGVGMFALVGSRSERLPHFSNLINRNRILLSEQIRRPSGFARSGRLEGEWEMQLRGRDLGKSDIAQNLPHTTGSMLRIEQCVCVWGRQIARLKEDHI